jgi:hypothetical protein
MDRDRKTENSCDLQILTGDYLWPTNQLINSTEQSNLEKLTVTQLLKKFPAVYGT